MNRLKEFFKSTLVGGLLVILPLAILVFFVLWTFNFVSNAIRSLIIAISPNIPLSALTDVLAIALIVSACFVVGMVVRTSLGKWIYTTFESHILIKAPGYKLVKEIVHQFLGNKQSPFSSVALVQIFGNETMVSAFVTETHKDGRCTVFVPTGPNPTSGNIYHLDAKYVHIVDVSVEDAMRSIISCGAGSSTLLKKIKT
jgi:uncharacterized membrane protein